MVEALAALEKNTLAYTPQPPDGVTYAAKIEKAEARIDWARSAAEVHNQIRGLSPWPGAFFEVRHEGRVERLKVLRVTQVQGSGAAGTLLDDAGTIACGDGAVRLIEVQRAGKKPMSLAELLRGFSLPAGTCVLATQADER